MAVKRNPIGPLTTSSLRRINEVFFWAPTRPRSIAPRVILLRNDLRLVPNDLVPGRKIFIPTRESLRVRGLIS